MSPLSSLPPPLLRTLFEFPGQAAREGCRFRGIPLCHYSGMSVWGAQASSLMAAWAAARRAMGTRKGEQDT